MTNTDNSIAIIGIGLRVPGASDLTAFWDLLCGRMHAIGPAPEGRFAESDTVVPGGFIDDIERFDAEFFGITPREAKLLDPQQRLLAETAWHAVEDAALTPQALTSHDTGVFVGASLQDHSVQLWQGVPDHFGLTASGHGMLANRLSYLFNLSGPSLTIDTACSSSLTAMHVARQSLLCGECDAAIVAGVQVLQLLSTTQCFSDAGLISADGHCRSFGDQGDGYGRSEGCVVVVLKRAADARRDRDRIYAVIRSSAIGHNGTSNGMAAPNPQSQERLLTRAYQMAGIDPRRVGYVEAHGAGTKLGDLMELQALSRVVGNPESPCIVGSLKGNIGNLEGAGGLVSVAKAALAIRNGLIPPNYHDEPLNPAAKFEKWGLRVADQGKNWTLPATARVAGVTALGVGGSNAHVVLSGVEESEPVTAHSPSAHLLLVSARSEQALVRLADTYCSLLNSASHDIEAVCASAARSRGHFPCRLAVLGVTADDLARGLNSWLKGSIADNVWFGTVPKRPVRLGVLFCSKSASRLAQTLDQLLVPSDSDAVCKNTPARLLDLGLKISVAAGEGLAWKDAVAFGERVSSAQSGKVPGVRRGVRLAYLGSRLEVDSLLSVKPAADFSQAEFWLQMGGAFEISRCDCVDATLEREQTFDNLALLSIAALSYVEGLLDPHASALWSRRFTSLPLYPFVGDRYALLVASKQEKPLVGEPEGDREVLPHQLTQAGVKRALADKLAQLTECSNIPVDVPLIELGVDSMVVVEFRNWITECFGFEVPVAKFLAGPTRALDGLAEYVFENKVIPVDKPRGEGPGSVDGPGLVEVTI